MEVVAFQSDLIVTVAGPNITKTISLPEQRLETLSTNSVPPCHASKVVLSPFKLSTFIYSSPESAAINTIFKSAQSLVASVGSFSL